MQPACLKSSKFFQPFQFDVNNKSCTQIYYGIVVIVSMIIAFIFYYIAMFELCAYKHLLHPPKTGEPVKEKTFDSLRMKPFLVSTFKYKKGTENIEAASETECVVCLTSFEDDEHVSQLPQCKQSFHAPCIDMWLYSHSDCPLCRTPIDRLSTQNGVMKSKQNFPDVTLPLPSKPHFSPRFFSIVYFQFFSYGSYNPEWYKSLRFISYNNSPLL